MTTIADQVESERSSLRRVLANRNLRRVQLAFFTSVIGDWAYGTALTVWAYLHGGPWGPSPRRGGWLSPSPDLWVPSSPTRCRGAPS
ncbi:hypothetical protein [Knoellia subterranea]|uniref:hypothetical protein n=1 Tax=Knoellia subterranea TaxID=184882 RepID=UPI0014704913|nr:hypothetical protein [Knoellia subterranea]